MDVLDFPPPATSQIQIAPGKAKLRLGAGIVACLIVFAKEHFPKSLGKTPLTNPDLIFSGNLRKCIDTASSALAGYTLALKARPLPGRSHGLTAPGAVDGFRFSFFVSHFLTFAALSLNLFFSALASRMTSPDRVCQHLMHPLFLTVLSLTEDLYVCLQVGQSQNTTVPERAFTISGVNLPFFFGCHSLASFG